MRRTMSAACALLVASLAVACTWVKPTAEGESVRVAGAAEVANCERKGKVTVSVKNRVAAVERKPTKVESELATLARNEAPAMGGDTVVAESAVSDGRQVYGIYDCGG